MELTTYLAIARKWWWLFVLCTLLGAGSSYLFSKRLAPTYESSSLLMVGGSLDVVNPTTGEMQTSEKLAQTYAELVKARPVMDATIATLGLAARPRVTVALVRNTQLMRITVADTRPDRAAATANELARQLILQSPSGPQRQEQAYREFVTSQLEELQGEINTLSKTIMTAQESGTDQETLVRMQTELSLRRTNYSALLAYIKDSSTNYIRVIEVAQAALIPVGPKVMQNTLLAAIVGLMLAAGVAFLIEYLDDSVKGQTDVEQALGLPTLGLVGTIPSNGAVTKGPIALAHPKSSLVEAYRMLGVNLRYSLPVSTPQRIFVVTSAGPGEGKSTTSANLAIVLAQAGQKTILVDSDLRRPALHRYLDCPNDAGLTSLLVGDETSLDAVLRPTPVPALSLLTSGPIPPNAAELLGSPRMVEILEELAARADVVVLDSPPVLAVADASLLSRLASGTLLVIEVGQTHLGACAQSVEAIKKVGGNVLGAILNRADPRRGGYYYYYYHHYYESADDSNGDGASNGTAPVPGRRLKSRRSGKPTPRSS